MIRAVIRFVVVLMVSLLIGTMFGIWVGFDPRDLSPGTYVEMQQHTIRALNTLMPIVGAVCIVLIVVLAALERGDRLICSLLIASAICLVAAGVITRFLNQPINAQVMTWSIQDPPSNWTAIRDQWWRWHVLRTLAGFAGLSLLLLATLIQRSRPIRRE